MTKGIWQYSLDGGARWKYVTGAGKSALMLGDTDRLRFVPDSAFAGSGKIAYKAWNHTSGGSHFPRGYITTSWAAFSRETEIATINVNTAPSLRSERGMRK